MDTYKDYKFFMREAIKEAEKSVTESGIPIGAVLVMDDKIISKGHNRLIQENSSILHAEMDCIENAGRLTGEEYQKTTLYTTLSPCPMCSGAVLLYKIPRVVIGESLTLSGPEKLLEKNGVKVINLKMKECQDILDKYIQANPEQWKNELEKVAGTTQLFF